MQSLLISLLFTVISSNQNDDTVGYGGMIVSPHYLASEAGINILKAGGSAADAAIAVQLVLNVVHPSGSGIGGGTFITYYDSDTQQVYAIDGREEAPDAFNPFVFCANITCFLENKKTSSCDNCDAIPWEERRTGGLGIGVPGMFSANKRMWDLFGKSEWSTLFEDAINIANNGFIMYQDLYNQIINYKDQLSRFPSTCKMILNYPYCNMSKYEVGDTVTFTDFATTLTILSLDADNAINNFYKGNIGKAIVTASQNSINPVTNRAGLLTKDDMKEYQAVFREPISSIFTQNNEEYSIYGMNMPSSGPLTVQYQLKMLEYLQTDDNFNSFDTSVFNNDELYSHDLLHYLFSAQNIAFADRDQYMADQDFVNVPIEGLQNKEYLQQRAIDYMSEMAQQLPIPYGEPEGFDDKQQTTTNEHGTAHICVVDQWGNVASITTSIEWVFGSFVVLDGYGFFLNNQLTDFSNVGIVNNEMVANGPEGGNNLRQSAMDTDSQTSGGKRPRSSMSPTIVLKNNMPYLLAGSEGGSSIIGTTFGIIARSIIYKIGPQLAVNAPRVWGRNNGNLEFEKSLWEEGNNNIVQQLINNRNYDENSLIEVSQGNGNAIKIDQNTRMLYCGADHTRWETSRCVAMCISPETCQFIIDDSSADTSSDSHFRSNSESGDSSRGPKRKHRKGKSKKNRKNNVLQNGENNEDETQAIYDGSSDGNVNGLIVFICVAAFIGLLVIGIAIALICYCHKSSKKHISVNDNDSECEDKVESVGGNNNNHATGVEMETLKV